MELQTLDIDGILTDIAHSPFRDLHLSDSFIEASDYPAFLYLPSEWFIRLPCVPKLFLQISILAITNDVSDNNVPILRRLLAACIVGRCDILREKNHACSVANALASYPLVIFVDTADEGRNEMSGT